MVDQNEMRRKALMDQMGGGNTGINGTPDVSSLAGPGLPSGKTAGVFAPAIAASTPMVGGKIAGDFAPAIAASTPMPASPLADAPAAARPNVTSLMEGDPAKLADPNHIAKSPKYQFLSEAQGYGRGQEGDLLKSLQSKYGQYWNGVTFDGKGNFNVGNNDPAWDGVKHVDAYGGYNDGGALKARWGVENPNAPQQAAPQGGMALPNLGGGDAQSNIAAQLAAMTQQSPNLAALIAQLGGQ